MLNICNNTKGQLSVVFFPCLNPLFYFRDTSTSLMSLSANYLQWQLGQQASRAAVHNQLLNKVSLLWHNAEFYGCSLVLLHWVCLHCSFSQHFFKNFFFFLHYCNIICNFPPQLWKKIFSVLGFTDHTIFCWFSASITSFITCTIELLILLHSFFAVLPVIQPPAMETPW